MAVLSGLVRALLMVFSMLWEILWPLILGFALWQAFFLGGVASFIFADLIILPILDIYRKYYSWKLMGYILVTFYITMAAVGYVVEMIFATLGIIPHDRTVAAITEASRGTTHRPQHHLPQRTGRDSNQEIWCSKRKERSKKHDSSDESRPVCGDSRR